MRVISSIDMTVYPQMNVLKLNLAQYSLRIHQNWIYYKLTFLTIKATRMSSSASKRHSLDGTLKVNETMFQFLKRKKHTELQQSLKKSPLSKSQRKDTPRISSASSRKDQSIVNLNHDDTLFNNSSTAIPSMYVYSNSDTKHRNQNRLNKERASDLTPRKISFAIADVPIQTRRQRFDYGGSASKSNSRIRPLAQLISPLKRQQRNISRGKQSVQAEKQPKSIMKKSTSKVDGDTNTFNKRKVKKSIQHIKQNFDQMLTNGQQADSKLNQLNLLLFNIVREIQKKHSNSDSSVTRVFGEIKELIRQLEKCLEIFKAQNQGQKDPVEQFHSDLSEYINTFQSNTNQLCDQVMEDKLIRVENLKNSEIAHLEKENSKLEREIQKLNSKIDKMERQSSLDADKQQSRIQNLLERLQNSKNQHNQEMSRIKEENLCLKAEVQAIEGSSKQVQKQLKEKYFSKQQEQSRLLKSQLDEAGERQKFLLEQISTLKGEFNNDISKLHTLYQSKQTQLYKSVQNLGQQIQRQRSQRACDKQVSDRILAEANSCRQQVGRLTKKDQELMNDLFRMNESLYQHWMALGDVKVLSQRLGMFRHFEMIYQDLAFNPMLFA